MRDMQTREDLERLERDLRSSARRGLSLEERREAERRIEVFRELLEITGELTITEALRRLKIWKGREIGHADITAN